MNKQNLEKNKKTLIAFTLISIFLLIIIFLILFMRYENNKPMLIIETPQKINIDEEKDITINVSVTTLGEAIYPAASMSISFDSSKLYFVGIEEGNVFITDNENHTGRKLPDWSVNPDYCNSSGIINIMYLDTTGGKHSFNNKLLSDNDNILLRLKFRLKGSLQKNDVCDLIFEDAVFASSDESQSLAMTTKTIKTKNGKIITGA